jgi:hypothetical protein
MINQFKIFHIAPINLRSYIIDFFDRLYSIKAYYKTPVSILKGLLMKKLFFLALLSSLTLHAMEEELSLKIEIIVKDSEPMEKTVPLEKAGICAGNMALRPNASFVIKNQDKSESYTYNIIAHDVTDIVINAQGIKTTPPDQKYVQYWVKKLTHKDNQLRNEEFSGVQGVQLLPGCKHRKPLSTLITSEETKSGIALLSATALILTILPPQANQSKM